MFDQHPDTSARWGTIPLVAPDDLAGVHPGGSHRCRGLRWRSDVAPVLHPGEQGALRTGRVCPAEGTTKEAPISVDGNRPDQLEQPDERLLATRDFDEAIAAFLSDAVHAVMAAADPIYASLRRIPLPEGVTRIRVQVGEADTASPEVQMTETAEIRLHDVVEGNLESMHEAIAQIGESHLWQFMRPFFEHIGDATEAIGNSMDFSGATFGWDDMLDAYERVEWAVDAVGLVRPPQITAGEGAAERINALPPPTPEQKERWITMQQRKQEEHVSRRRRRRLR